MLHDGKTKNIKITAVGAVLGGRFGHTSELKVVKFNEAMKRLDSNKWKEEIKIKHTIMVTNRAWEQLEEK